MSEVRLDPILKTIWGITAITFVGIGIGLLFGAPYTYLVDGCGYAYLFYRWRS